MTTIDSPTTLREQLEQRRTKRATTGLLRLPFFLDQDLAEQVEDLGKRCASLEDRLEDLTDSLVDDDELSDGDVRASGHDLSPAAGEVAELEAELARARAELADAIGAVDAARITLLFRRCSADEYEQLLRKHGGASIQGGSDDERQFLNALTERCFVAIEMADGSRDDMSWADFVKSADLSMGELAPIRAMVFAENARGGNSVPFSSASSRRTRNS